MKVLSWNHPEQHPGHYAPAVISNGMLYVSGQLPVREEAPGVVEGQLEDQLALVFQNIQTILAQCSLTLQDIVRVTIYTSDLSLWPRINSFYAELLGDHKPARTVVPTCQLHYGALVEVDVIAELRGDV